MGPYGSRGFSKAELGLCFYNINEKAFILLKVSERHLPSETEHQAVMGDSEITSMTCCLIRWWPFVMSAEQMESFVQVTVCDQVN